MCVHLNGLKFHIVKEGQAVTQNLKLGIERVHRPKFEVIVHLEKAIHVIVTEN